MKRYLSFLLPVLLLAACAQKQDNRQAGQDSTAAQTEASPTASGFKETHRPRFHFSPVKMWMNDPNGMVYHKGEYHLFYQHYPDSTVWGPMHWGHAVSKDMIHWEHLPIALYPDSLGWIFSGSAVVDVNNTTGLGSRENPPMVAIFTYHSDEKAKAKRKDFQTQGIAYSTDNGRTWTKYQDNPVVPNPGIADFRDPKVSWHEASKQWVMILAVADHVELYGSKNLKNWSKLSEFGKTYGAHGGVWECPDLFPLTIDGKQKWVMLVSINPGGIHGGSATQYFIGNFDGKTFTSDHQPNTTLWLDYGKDNYAGVTWSNIPATDGRRLFLGWMSNWQYANVVPTSPWRSAMTLPRELNLRKTAAGLRVVSQPVKELAYIRGESKEIPGQPITGQVSISDGIAFDVSASEMHLEFDSIQPGQDLGVALSNGQGQQVLVGYDAGKKSFYIDRTQSGKNDFSKEFAGRHTAPRIATARSLKLHLLIDVASVELFADEGEVTMTEIYFPDTPFNQVTVYSKNGKGLLKSGKITQLKSIWEGNEKVAIK